MTTFSSLPEFEKELKRLAKKYPTLVSDIKDIEEIICESPTGIGKNFTLIHTSEDTKVVKVRVQCESLRARTIRMVYAYRAQRVEFMYIELYFKGEKENEDRERIQEYLKRKE